MIIESIESKRQTEGKTNQIITWFCNHHPYIGGLLMCIIMPIAILLAVTIVTTAVMLPISFLLGWI